jgi:succinoglycan biosynthesis protein ExoA
VVSGTTVRTERGSPARGLGDPPVASRETSSVAERVTIVIPCLNEAERIGALLDGIQALDVRPNQVVVVDTGSSDATRDVVRQYQHRHQDLPIRLLHHPGVGVAAAVNAGIEAADGDVIVRLDGHSCPRRDYVRRALTALRETGAAVVGGVWDIRPGGASRGAEAIALAVSHPLGAGNAKYRTGGHPKVSREVDTVPFGCFRKTTWLAVGRFNEALLTNEDYEFNYRIRARGLAVVLDARMRCIYFARATLVSLAAQYFRYGWWKARMVRLHPQSLRWRQMLPAGLAPALGALVVLALWWPAWRPAPVGFLAVYGAVVCLCAVDLIRRRRRWDLLVALPAAFMVEHWAWSVGFGIHAATGGRWPRWVARTGPTDDCTSRVADPVDAPR